MLVKPMNRDESLQRFKSRMAETTRSQSATNRKPIHVRSIQRNGHPGGDTASLARSLVSSGHTAGRGGGQAAGPLGGHPAGRGSGTAGHGGVHSGIGAGRDMHHKLQERLHGGHLNAITHSRTGRRLDLERQYRYHASGDLTRRLGLHHNVTHHGGWRSYHHCGRISSGYLSLHFGHHYCGPSLYPSRVWWPHWTDWVRWSWWDHCHWGYDPRPVICQPIVYQSCSPVVVYDYPVWEPLHAADSGTWVDVPEQSVAPLHYDVQLLAVRFVDAGHPEQKIGPRFRVWVRNNSERDVAQPFNVTVIAAAGDQVTEGLPQVGVRVEAIKAGETQALDLRLPWEVYELVRDTEGRALPFAKLHVVTDSHFELEETSEENNGIVLAREDILPVDPAAFSTDVDTVAAGGLVSIAGEGLGPEPGQVLVYVKGLELEAEIQGWYDLGVRIKVPDLPLTEETEAELVVVRGDAVATNPVKLTLAPSGTELLPVPQPSQ